MATLTDVWGHEVSLSGERTAHLRQHPEMRGQEEKLAETLLQPDMVIQSRSDESIRLFHRFYKQLAIGEKYLCVVVKYAENSAFIITAYFTDKVKSGEIIWKK
jgi:molybdopterin synthase catalytic subunit